MTARALGQLILTLWGLSGCSVAMPYVQQSSQKNQIRERAGQEMAHNPRLAEATQAFRDLGAVNAKVAPLAIPQINAASIGDGHFFVSEGLLRIENQCLLWGIIAHELAHDELKHADQRVRTAAGIGMLSIAAGVFGAGGGVSVSVSGTSWIPAFGRSQESDADARATQLLRRAGKPTWALRYAFDFMTEVGGDTSGGWLSSHPLTSARLVMQPAYMSDQVADLCPSEATRAEQIAAAKAATAHWEKDATEQAAKKD